MMPAGAGSDLCAYEDGKRLMTKKVQVWKIIALELAFLCGRVARTLCNPAVSDKPKRRMLGSGANVGLIIRNCRRRARLRNDSICHRSKPQGRDGLMLEPFFRTVRRDWRGAVVALRLICRHAEPSELLATSPLADSSGALVNHFSRPKLSDERLNVCRNREILVWAASYGEDTDSVGFDKSRAGKWRPRIFWSAWTDKIAFFRHTTHPESTTLSRFRARWNGFLV